jgi:hypothetical protein
VISPSLLTKKRDAILAKLGYTIKEVEGGIFGEADGDEEYIKAWVKYAIDGEVKPQRKEKVYRNDKNEKNNRDDRNK